MAIAWIFCGRLHAYLSTQSLLMAILHSLIARRRFGPQTQWRPLRKTLTSGLRLNDISLAWPAVVQLFVVTLTHSGISHKYSSLFILVINLWFLCFRFDALTEVGAFMRTDFLYIPVFRAASGPTVLAGCRSALNPQQFILLTVLRRWSWCFSYSLELFVIFCFVLFFLLFFLFLFFFVVVVLFIYLFIYLFYLFIFLSPDRKVREDRYVRGI